MPHVGQGLAYLPTESNVENETRLFIGFLFVPTVPASFFHIGTQAPNLVMSLGTHLRLSCI